MKNLDGDDTEDIVYTILDPKVKGSGLNYGYSLHVLLGKKDGGFQKDKTVKTFPSM